MVVGQYGWLSLSMIQRGLRVRALAIENEAGTTEKEARNSTRAKSRSKRRRR